MKQANEEELSVEDQLKQKLAKLRDGGYFGKKYAKKIAEQCGVKLTVVYNTAAGNSINQDVAEALLDLAAENKLVRLNERADEILAD